MCIVKYIYKINEKKGASRRSLQRLEKYRGAKCDQSTITISTNIPILENSLVTQLKTKSWIKSYDTFQLSYTLPKHVLCEYEIKAGKGLRGMQDEARW